MKLIINKRVIEHVRSFEIIDIDQIFGEIRIKYKTEESALNFGKEYIYEDVDPSTDTIQLLNDTKF